MPLPSIQSCIHLLLCLLLILSCTGCGRSSGPADLVIINGKEPESLDPAIMSGEAEGRIVQALFEGLTRYNSTNGLAEAGLAENWTISPDGTTYRFRIRSQAAWSDGTPITSADVAYSWLRMIDPVTGSQYNGPFIHIRNAAEYQSGRIKDPQQVGIRTPEKHVFEVDLLHPVPYFLELCAYAAMAVVPRQTIDKHGDAWLTRGNPPGSGAYELVEWRINDRVRLKRNSYYWDSKNTRSGIVDLLPVSHPTTALNLYLSGAADVIWDKDLVPTELVDVLKKRSDFHSFDYLGSYFIRFNVRRKPFDDPRVRKALGMAIDKRRIVEQITRGGERVAGNLVPPGIPGYVSPTGVGYDPDQARELLKQAGYPGGRGFPAFHYHFDSRKTQENIAVQIQAMWLKELGLKAELRPQEWQVYLNTQTQGDYDISRSSWIGDYNDPTTFLDLFMSGNLGNRTGWKNAEYDQIMEKAAREGDRGRRAQLLREAEIILVEKEMPVVPVYFYAGMECWNRENVQGIHPNLRAEHPVRAIARISHAGSSSKREDTP